MPTVLTKANDRLRRCRDLSGSSICVALSGGKDSLVILDLCCKHFSRVEAFHMYLVRGLRCVEGPVDAVASKYGVKVTYVPHWDLARMLKNGVLCKHVDGTENFRELAQKDVEASLQTRLSVEWFAYGDRASDSFVRRFYTRDNDGLRMRGIPKLYPIWDWTDSNVYGYMRANKIQAPTRFGSSKKQSGFSLTPDVLRWLKEKHPEDFRTVERAFPFVGATIFNG